MIADHIDGIIGIMIGVVFYSLYVSKKQTFNAKYKKLKPISIQL